MNKRPFVGPTQTPPSPNVFVPYKQSLHHNTPGSADANQTASTPVRRRQTTPASTGHSKEVWKAAAVPLACEAHQYRASPARDWAPSCDKWAHSRCPPCLSGPTKSTTHGLPCRIGSGPLLRPTDQTHPTVVWTATVIVTICEAQQKRKTRERTTGRQPVSPPFLQEQYILSIAVHWKCLCPTRQAARQSTRKQCCIGVCHGPVSLKVSKSKGQDDRRTWHYTHVHGTNIEFDSHSHRTKCSRSPRETCIRQV